jgi:four helix bundle suffix protein
MGELITTHGGYRHLRSFQVSEIIYDLTVRFCDQYIDRRSRTHDQMVQAARSGRQNIAEGSMASATSKKTELKLTNVARASLEELRLDYEDYLRHRRLPLWGRHDARRAALIDGRPQSADDVARWAKWVRESGHSGLGGHGGQKSGEDTSVGSSSTESTKSTLPDYPEIAANGALALINVAIYLLSRQIDTLAKEFETHGGFTERLYNVRREQRRR